MSLADVQQMVDDLVRDRDQVITTTQRDAAISAAVSRYSTDAPAPRVEDVTSVAGGSFLPLPTGWIIGLSTLRGIEYPVGNVPPSYVGLDAVTLYAGPTTLELLLLISLLAGDVVRVSYTGAHVLDNTTDTLPGHHRRAVACLAAADLCGQLSAHYATEGAPTLSADTVDHTGKSERFRSRSRDLASEYTRVVGTPRAEAQKPACAVVDVGSQDSLGGRPLFHPPRRWPR